MLRLEGGPAGTEAKLAHFADAGLETATGSRCSQLAKAGGREAAVKGAERESCPFAGDGEEALSILRTRHRNLQAA